MSIDRYSDYKKTIDELDREGTLRHLTSLHISGKYVEIDGRRLLNFSGNSYLGLPDTLPTDTPPFNAQEYPFSAASSRLLTGNDAVYDSFEQLLCEVYGVPTALIWSSGYHANSGSIPVLCDSDTLILADRLVHASMIDGIMHSGARFLRFRHNDVHHLASLLAKEASNYKRIWILIESIYSMDGDEAPLEEIVALKKNYPNAYLYVDEAHGVGVVGKKGLGLTQKLGRVDQVDFLLGTLGKALGSVGAFTLQNETLRSLLISRSRPFIFNTALPPVNVAWSEHLFRAMMKMEKERHHLKELSQIVVDELSLSIDKPSHIIPIIIPGVDECTSIANALCEEGYYVRPIRKPTVPKGSERIRLSLSAAMTKEEVLGLTSALKKHLASK